MLVHLLYPHLCTHRLEIDVNPLEPSQIMCGTLLKLGLGLPRYQSQHSHFTILQEGLPSSQEFQRLYQGLAAFYLAPDKCLCSGGDGDLPGTRI